MDLFALLLQFVHFLVNLRSYILRWYITVKNFGIFHPKVTLKLVRDQTPLLTKHPHHVGIVIVEQTVSVKDLVKITVWCMAMGIPCITLYDRKGVCVKNHEVFQKRLAEHMQVFFEKEAASYSVNVHSRRCSRPKNGGSKPNFHVDIILVGPEDGRGSIVEATRQLVDIVSHQDGISEDPQALITAMYSNQYGFPDPELALKFGSVQSTLGYLPWQLQLTEILSMPTHHNIQYETIKLALQSFGNSVQRYGK